MKNTFFFISLLLSTLVVDGQAGVSLQVSYAYSGVTDLNDVSRKSEGTFVLQVTHSASAFFDPVRRGLDSLYALDIANGLDEMALLANISKYRGGLAFQSYADFTTGRMQVFDNLGAWFSYEEPLSLQDWQLHEETKTILGRTAKKATTSFRGRNFTAWYDADLPVAAGPWKFGGLPGLILQVGDDEGHYQFECTAIESFAGNPVRPHITNARAVSFSEFSRLKQLRVENPAAFIDAIVPGMKIAPADEQARLEWQALQTGRIRFNPIERL